MINVLIRCGSKISLFIGLAVCNLSIAFAQDTAIATTQTVQPAATITTQTVQPPSTITTKTIEQPATITTQTVQQPARVTTTSVQQPATLNEFEQWLRNNNQTTTLTRSNGTVTRVVTRRVQRRPMRRPLTYEEGQQRLLESIPESSIPRPPESDIAFNTLMQQNMPLSPRQVVKLHQEIDLSQRAAAVPPSIPPKPVSTTLMINLAPGTTPPAIRLAQGYVSALMFVDSTGTPWPIASFDIGNPKAVNIQWDGKTNIILIQAVSPYTNGDIVVRLVGLPTPITMELVTGQRVVDYRVDIHVSGIGPNTKEIPIGTNLPSPANQMLLGILDGVGPEGSRLLVVRGADAQAWLMGDRMFLRTRLTLLSPGWMGKMVSPDGMNAYELPRTSSVLVSRYGEPAELRIEGF